MSEGLSTNNVGMSEGLSTNNVGMSEGLSTNNVGMSETLYIATTGPQLLSCLGDVLCMIVAYDDPVAAVARYHYATMRAPIPHSQLHSPVCTLFVIKGRGGFRKDAVVPSKYTYRGRGAHLDIVQQITLSPDNYLHDWCTMNTITNYKI